MNGYYKKFEVEKIISQIVGISEGCDQNGDRCVEHPFGLRMFCIVWLIGV